MIANIERDGQMFFWRDIIPTVARDKESLSVHQIPADEGHFQLNIATMTAAFGDMFITLVGTKSDRHFTYLRGIRLRSLVGGGLNPFITEGFGSILGYFARGMREIPEIEPEWRERLNPAAGIEVKRGMKKDEPRLSIISIPDDDANPDFVDIFILRGGDVKLRMRHKEPYSKKEIVGEMLFKTSEHGGRTPFVATALTRLAEKISKLEKRK
jgi:hypothetical protein